MAIILLAVVATEMVVLPLLVPRLAWVGVPTTAIVHAVVLAAVLTTLLWRLVWRPFRLHIQEHDQLRGLLRESGCRFRAIAENAHEWIWEVDSSGRYVNASPMVT